ncbi:Nif3-like dinuclear metal center hexameric protein [Budviciaceae bacterium CWB-B4]|uniref:GTP cyclohydrolase 1 type 2 homolog n=1 Tax=Limnobaculum xujianqingii TaxID=2738837 RepID=A0A9D7FRW9_9GAMM|nr:Nif3-like dinuclear metal center hexameric protein [Limnobaculum xujianqingii]MBK5072449.1 Nif3-like dinuclear metal center hexameric protein [Limnobaculum xujianqingii]MBK5175758.1 Nif3-like dinuclear metal center hexameric protein [Limnobaculum xujianqingii]
MLNRELERLLNDELKVRQFRDYAPNGLQVEGRAQVKRIVTGVTACQALLDAAVELKADTVLVHHGYFWKNDEPVITGMMHKRLKTLLNHDINLFGYHLPLDGHPTLGNNALLGDILGFHHVSSLDPLSPDCLIWQSTLDIPLTGSALAERIAHRLGREPLHCGDNAPAEIRRVAWCTGGAQDYIKQAAENGFDAFITGEVSERTIHIAREMGIHFYSAGHHATERYGIKALGEWLAEHHQFDVTFIDIDNPV